MNYIMPQKNQLKYFFNDTCERIIYISGEGYCVTNAFKINEISNSNMNKLKFTSLIVFENYPRKYNFYKRKVH